MSDDFFDDVIHDEINLDEDEADESEPEAEIESSEVEARSVVLVKQDMIALLGLKTSSQGGLIVRLDPRQESPAAQTYDDAEVAAKWFNRSVRTSRKNGWTVIYDGAPSFG